MLTLGDVLLKTFPRLFEIELGDNGEITISKKCKFEVVLQGVEADMNTPMYWTATQHELSRKLPLYFPALYVNLTFK